MTVLDRKLITRMVNPQPGGNGGGGGYVPQSQDVSWTDINGKPTTLAGYGITDAYWATTQSTSDKRNLTIGSVTQQVITAHQSLYGYATEYWVGQQGYLTSVSWDDVSGKPETYPPSAHSHSWSSITGKPTSKTAWGKTFWDANGDPQSISGDLSAGSNGGTISQFHSIELNSAGSLGGYGGFIDFHFNGSSADYTSRIIEDAAGEINIDATIKVNRINSRSSVKALSDARHKDVKRDLNMTVEQIAAMPAVIFEWLGKDLKDIDPGEHVGTLAQEWQKILPQAVSEQKDGTLTMGYGEAALVSVITLARRVLKLERRVSKLEKEIAKLKEQKNVTE